MKGSASDHYLRKAAREGGCKLHLRQKTHDGGVLLHKLDQLIEVSLLVIPLVQCSHCEERSVSVNESTIFSPLALSWPLDFAGQ